MLISIITVVFNNSNTILNSILSVKSQTYSNIEHIIIDGGSTDGTLDILNENINLFNILITEKDNGLYDAINKGILLANGEIVGILNSDDVFYDNNTITDIASIFNKNSNLDSVIGDIIFLNHKGKPHRHYSSKNWTPKKFAYGLMPPHPTFYCKRQIFMKYGLYRLDYKIAADYELLIRFLYVNKITYAYIPKILVIMSLGGISTKNIISKLQINKEVLSACKINNINTNIFKLFTKYIFKLKEFL